MKDIYKTLDEVTDKFGKQGQDPEVYLQGLKYSKPITYWDYCEVDTLLSLQKPRTVLPDENVFIMYHQVNELLFKMMLSEIMQISNQPRLERQFFSERLGRISRYFDVLASSFNIMTDGMEVEQYLKFRTALTPASGFQSAQYRKIEICCTDFNRLIDLRYRDGISPTATWEEKFSKVYWQAAGIDPTTGSKNMMLSLFEKRYLKELIELADAYKGKNLWARFLSLPAKDRKDDELIKALRHLDYTINIRWVMAHYSTAKKYLERDGDVTEATGGSDWKKYMHPQYQKRIFYPDLWSKEELDNWGIDNLKNN